MDGEDGLPRQREQQVQRPSSENELRRSGQKASVALTQGKNEAGEGVRGLTM